MDPEDNGGGKGGGGGSGWSANTGAMAGLGALGLALDVVGTLGKMKAQKEEYAQSMRQASDESAINDLRFQQMGLNKQRQELQNLRVTQQQQAMARAAAASKGAQFGSGLAGGLSQEAAQSAGNVRDISQNYGIGKGIYEATRDIDQSKIMEAGAQSKAATSSGWMQLGADIMGSASKAAMMI